MTPHPIDMTRYQLANCYMGRAGLINSGGASGATDLQDAVRTAVINKRAGGMGLISGRKAFQRPDGRGRRAAERDPGRLPLDESRSRDRRPPRGEGWGVMHLYFRLAGDRREPIDIAQVEALVAELSRGAATRRSGRLCSANAPTSG